MKREDYWLLANALAAVPNSERKYGVVLKLIELFKADDPKFKPELFLEACE